MSERLLLHRVHPAKLSMDITAAVLSSALLWRHHLALGLGVRYALSVLGSLVVLRPTWLMLGAAVVLAGWSHGVWG